MEDELTQVNVQMPADLRALLDEMVSTDESDRSKFIRRLIRQEHARRQAQQLPLPLPEKPARRQERKTIAAAA
jgi:metal-responsive CopG/Arc/MetJ family transcriptional regulator